MDNESETFADYSEKKKKKMVAEIDKERIAAALTTLTDCQRVLFEKVFIERKKIIEIAKEEGVCHQAISQRVERIKAKLKKLLA